MITSGLRLKLDTLALAFATGSVVLVDCVHKATGLPIPVLCITLPEGTGPAGVIPVAILAAETSMFEEIEPPSKVFLLKKDPVLG